jgi:predicted enzyme related to lactoylglutathione lyase
MPRIPLNSRIAYSKPSRRDNMATKSQKTTARSKKPATKPKGAVKGQPQSKQPQKKIQSPLCHFEIIASNMERSQAFYEGVFHWSFSESKSSAGRRRQTHQSIDTGTTVTGALAQKPANAAAPMLNVFFLVDDVEDTLKRVEANHGKVIFPAMKIPGMGLLGMFEDPDGLQVGIVQPAPRNKILKVKQALRSGLLLHGGLFYSSDDVALTMIAEGE